MAVLWHDFSLGYNKPRQSVFRFPVGKGETAYNVRTMIKNRICRCEGIERNSSGYRVFMAFGAHGVVPCFGRVPTVLVAYRSNGATG